jgi:hypothetical protein
VPPLSIPLFCGSEITQARGGRGGELVVDGFMKINVPPNAAGAVVEMRERIRDLLHVFVEKVRVSSLRTFILPS